ncbi:hypothetical protein LTS08_002684 [Lithohypha guttulata]|uniref:Uncharacterized protein n=1 Tax=Lithohypha guttulata TaxID=1690604 RepID=A0AAN7T6C5_9EURO|nr:hypothetical protein LTR05_000587 [Lithohypha guttulata]KAK5104791.1 hypothetical protein LTS08_002684 [Lithohypha guttulata]
MSTGSTGPAGVKNLRAMFEHKTSDQSTSPSSRGRSSPNGSLASSNSRPVSKVRSSFVAVERSGEAGQPSQWGLRKTSDVSSMAEVREEALTGDTTNEASHTSTVEGSDLGAILKGSAFETSSLPPVNGSSESMEDTHNGTAAEKPQMNAHTENAAPVSGNIEPEGPPPTSTPSVANIESKLAKPTPSSLDMKSIASKPKESSRPFKKSPTLQKKSQTSPSISDSPGSRVEPRGGVNKIAGVTQFANKAKMERTKPEQTKKDTSPLAEKKAGATVVKPPSVASKPTAASRAHAQQRTTTSETVQPKSPSSTRPVKLPSAATATTAASTARKGPSTATENPVPVPERRSTNTQTPRVANTATKSSIAKKASRVSLANGGEDMTRSRSSAVHKPADEGFLARMTRATASSAQKAHEKVQVDSPPRATNRRLSLGSKKPASRKSLSGVSQEQSGAQPTLPDAIPASEEQTILEAVTHATDAGHDEDEAEPIPAQDHHEAVVIPQQAEVTGGTVA